MQTGNPPEDWTLPSLLSVPRLAPYVAAVPSGSWEDALALYDWNVQVSGAFFESLHYLEIGLRNVLDTHLSAWATTLGSEQSWFSAQEIPLSQQSREKVRWARRQATQGERTETHGRVVAELMFGFWWSLLATEYNRSLWAPCLRHAFEGSVRRQRLHTALDELRRLRNRIAHHEPIHTRALDSDLTLLLDTAGRISGVLEEHIALTTRVPVLLTRRPGLPASK